MSKIIAIRAIDWSAILGIAKNKTFAIDAVCDYAFFEAFWRSRIFENMSVSEKNFRKNFRTVTGVVRFESASPGGLEKAVFGTSGRRQRPLEAKNSDFYVILGVNMSILCKNSSIFSISGQSNGLIRTVSTS